MKTQRFFFLLFPMAAAIVLGACQKKKSATEEPPSDPNIVHLTRQQLKSIGTDTVKYTNGENMLTLTGKVSFDEDKVSKVYPMASGNVVHVYVSLGDHVNKGQLLAVMRSSEINDVQNQYDVALANQKIAKKNVDNAEQLFKSNYYSENQVLSARNDYKKAESDVNKLKQQLQILGANSDKNDAEYRIAAPTDGYIVEKNITDNMQVRSDNATNLFTVSYLNTVWVLADVYESDLSSVHIGDSVDITTVAYPDKIFKGTVQRISSLLDPTTKTLKLRIVLDNKDNLLKPEMFAIANVHGANGSTKKLSIPTKALVFDNSHYTVMVAVNDTTFKKRPVDIFRIEGDRTYILKGLVAGERVVTDGSLLVSYSGE